MGTITAIAWCDHTFNPWMGCFKVSQGCKNCYADLLTQTKLKLDVFGADTDKRKRTGPATWKKPLRWNREAQAERQPSRVFCASLADVFEDAPGPNRWRTELWSLIRETPWLDYQLLTKRPENIARMLPDDWAEGHYPYYPNVWLGTSIEDDHVAERGPVLTSVPAFLHFVSYEPAIGPLVTLDLHHIEWMIVGGESGPNYRSMDLRWAADMKVRCNEAGVAYFFKQNSAYRTEMGIDALGRVYRAYPDSWDRLAAIRLAAEVAATKDLEEAA